MLRFVVGPDRTVVPDIAATLPGRGIWLSARGDVIETARTRGAFHRAAPKGPNGGQVTVAADLLSVLQAGLVRRISELLGLTRRAGQAVCGYQKAREWVQSGRAGLVVQAADGSAAECARLRSGLSAGVGVVTPLPAAALGAIFGRDHVVHVAVAPGKLATALRMECDRLAGLRGPAAEMTDSPPGDGAGRAATTTDDNGRVGA
jgi:ribosomal protein L7Ae-like RNA K-turn-binding protein